MEKLQILEKIAPFNFLDQTALQEIGPRIQEKVFSKGSFIFKQGDASLRTLFILTEGVVEIIVRNEKEIETVVGLHKPYDFFGETVIMSEERYPASVRSVTNCKCLLLDKESVDYLIQHSSEFSSFFSRILTDRLRDMFQEVILEQSYDAYGMEAQPFRKRVCDIMTSPVITCRETNLVTTAARILTKNKIGALVVVNRAKKPVGIITDSDLVSRVLTKSDFSISEITVGDIMTPHAITLRPDAFFYQALLTMVKNQIKQIPIMEGDTLLGIVTLRDLVQSRSTGALTIVDTIESEKTIEGLKKASQGIDNVLKALIAEKASSREICEVMTEFYDRLTRKILEICQKQMDDEGYGQTPVDYCWITMGSNGRKEQITRTDQDNAIIYEDTEPDKAKEVADYFAKLAAKTVDGLYQCGFALCKGNVMATNPQWCKPYKDWLTMVTHWVHEPHSEMLRNFTIFLDFRPVYGTKELADKLKIAVIRRIQDNPIVLHFLARDDLSQSVPLGFFKKFVTNKSKEHKGEIDLKTNALVHIVDCIRIFSVRDGITATNTFERLKELTVKEILPKDDTEFIEASYETLLTFRNRENLRKLSLGLEPDNYFNPYILSKREQAVLRESFKAITRLQNFTGSYFRVEGY
ncbi:MAG: DUF294 nucleotidyltransferase-like domain-containing protein [Eubacteriales bacterium]